MDRKIKKKKEDMLLRDSSQFLKAVTNSKKKNPTDRITIKKNERS